MWSTKINIIQTQELILRCKDSEGFDVVAALTGTVTKVEEDALLGNVIEIDHDNGIVTQYQSVKDMTVKVGDEVEQGRDYCDCWKKHDQ